jgi:hypothetical protein
MYAAAARALRRRGDFEAAKAVRVYSEKEIESGQHVEYSTMTPEAAMAHKTAELCRELAEEFESLSQEQSND